MPIYHPPICIWLLSGSMPAMCYRLRYHWRVIFVLFGGNVSCTYKHHSLLYLGQNIVPIQSFPRFLKNGECWERMEGDCGKRTETTLIISCIICWWIQYCQPCSLPVQSCVTLTDSVFFKFFSLILDSGDNPLSLSHCLGLSVTQTASI